METMVRQPSDYPQLQADFSNEQGSIIDEQRERDTEPVTLVLRLSNTQIQTNDMATEPPRGWKKSSYNEHDLREAWWGNELTDQSVVDIDQTVEGIDAPLGQILLRQEYVITRDLLESYASKNPRNGIVITGQPGIGQCK